MIPNGYDSEFFSNFVYQKNDNFKIIHIGNWGADQNAPAFFRALKEISDNNSLFSKKLKLINYGKVADVIQSSIKEWGLKDKFINNEYIPYRELTKELVSADLLLIIIARAKNNETFISAKIFDYLGAKRPIFAIAPLNGELAKIIKNLKVGTVVNYDDSNIMKDLLRKLYHQWRFKQGIPFNGLSAEKFNRKNIIRDLVSQLNKIVEE